jgi:uncharacterized protein
MSTTQRVEKSEFKAAKKLLYVLRTALTGRHVLETAEIETDLNTLAARYGVQGVVDLIEIKNRQEKAELPAALGLKWKSAAEVLFAELETAKQRSALPAQATDEVTQRLESWLIALRLKSLL